MTMRPLRAANNAISTLDGGINSTANSLLVQTGDGGLFPAAPFIVTVESEIIRVGSKSGDTFSNLTRGHEGTVAAAHGDQATVEHRWTAGTLRGVYDMFGLVHIARFTDEVSTNSESASTVITFSGLSIPPHAPITVTGLSGKNSGSAVYAQLGFGLNAVNIDPTGNTLSRTAVWSSTDIDRGESGQFILWIPPRRGNYVRTAMGMMLMSTGVGITSVQSTYPTNGVSMPIETITEVRIRGRSVGSTAVSVFVRDVHLYIGIEADKL